MAGELAGFDPDAFRTNIRNTMIMGLPTPTELRPTFYFRKTISYPDGTVVDPKGRAIDPRVQATVTTRDPVQVPVAVEYAPDSTNDGSLAGTFWSDRAVVTILDEDYTTVEDAIEVDLSGRRFLIQQQKFVVGLGTVTVYQLPVYLKGTGGSE